MKLLLALTLTLNVFANICTGSLGQVWEDSENNGNFKILKEYEHQINRALWDRLPNINEFDYETCKDATTIRYIRDKEAKKNYTLYYTVEDYCDGGNSYGAITYKGKVVAEIADGDFLCL